MESKLISYEIFIDKRPDMEIHTEASINSCINSAYVLLDGECASLISRVEQFNFNENGLNPNRDTNDTLYRTDFELGQLQEALIFQVQYVLNMGNDFTIGGGSYSIGNVNSSYNRPEGRELIAPGVYKLLSNARVYNLNAFGSFNQVDKELIPLSTSKEIMERVNKEYVSINQPNAQVGQVAYVNQSNKVDFGNPQDLQITTYNTQRVAGPEGYRTNYYEIDNVPNIAFFGNDLNGTYSAVHRGEINNLVIDLVHKININDLNGLTKEQIYNAIYASGILWNSQIEYKKDWIVQIVNNKNELLYYQALQDNININPLNDNGTIWKKIETQEIDLNVLMEQIKPLLPPLVQEAVDKLPNVEFISEATGEVIEFYGDNEQDINDKVQAYCNTYGISQNDYLKEIQEEPKDYYTQEEVNDLLSELAHLREQNTFENINTFNDSVIFGDNDYEYDKASGKLLAQSPKAQTIVNNNQLVTKAYIDNALIPKAKINVLFGYEYNTNGHYYSENTYSLSLPNEVLDSTKKFMGIIYTGNRDGINCLNQITFLYQYNVTDKNYPQVITSTSIFKDPNQQSGNPIALSLKNGKFRRFDTWDSGNGQVLYGIRFIEI